MFDVWGANAVPGRDYKKHDGPLPFDGDNLFEFILEYDPNLVFVKDEESRLVYANRAFREIYSPQVRDTIIGSTTVEKFTEEEANLFLEEDRRAMEQGHTEIVEDILDWKGEKRTLLTRKFAIQKPGGDKLLVAIATDISTLSSREKRLVRLNAQLKVYSHSIAHDLKNPMASLMAGLNIIKRDKQNTLSERSTAVLGSIMDSTMGLSGYISSMLKAAAAEARELDFAKHDINLLMEEVRFNLSAAIEAADLTLNIARMPVSVVEPNLLRQLFQNLIENAIKHAGVEKIRVTIHYEDDGENHIFFVTDNGKGIPDDRKEQIFNQFFREGQADGLGLGLTVCQRIAHLHDGFLEVRDTSSGGACFVLHIPKNLSSRGLSQASL